MLAPGNVMPSISKDTHTKQHLNYILSRMVLVSIGGAAQKSKPSALEMFLVSIGETWPHNICNAMVCVSLFQRLNDHYEFMSVSNTRLHAPENFKRNGPSMRKSRRLLRSWCGNRRDRATPSLDPSDLSKAARTDSCGCGSPMQPQRGCGR